EPRPFDQIHRLLVRRLADRQTGTADRGTVIQWSLQEHAPHARALGNGRRRSGEDRHRRRTGEPSTAAAWPEAYVWPRCTAQGALEARTALRNAGQIDRLQPAHDHAGCQPELGALPDGECVVEPRRRDHPMLVEPRNPVERQPPAAGRAASAEKYGARAEPLGVTALTSRAGIVEQHDV